MLLLVVALSYLVISSNGNVVKPILDDGVRAHSQTADMSYKFSAFAAFNREIEKEIGTQSQQSTSKTKRQSGVIRPLFNAVPTEKPTQTPTSNLVINSIKFHSAFLTDVPSQTPTTSLILNSYRYHSAFLTDQPSQYPTTSAPSTFQPSDIPTTSSSPTTSQPSAYPTTSSPSTSQPSQPSQYPTTESPQTNSPTESPAFKAGALPLCYLSAYCATNGTNPCISGTYCSTGSPNICLLDSSKDLTSSCTANHGDCSSQSTCCSSAFACTAVGSSKVCTRITPPLCSIVQSAATSSAAAGISGQITPF